jgi:hypothetical protein
VGDTSPIGSYEDGKSPYGVYDMAGNVAEWVADWYKSYPGNTANFSREERVVRGGSWFSFSASLYTSYRSSENPSLHTYGTGFRCALSVESVTQPEDITTSAAASTTLTTASQFPVCDRDSAKAEFVGDVTIPDGTVMTPGQVFLKTWRVRNSGTCSWGEGYNLVYYFGEEMSGQPVLSATEIVEPGQEVEISVQFTAPTTPGEYRGLWIMANAEGISFGNALFVQIVVQ